MAINFPTSPSVNDTHTDGDMVWKWDGSSWEAVIETSIPIPSQSGQAGEYLKTDGTTMSWEPITSATATAVSDQANTSTGYFDLPAGTTAQRPGSPATGMIRFNETDTSLEHYADGSWIGFAGSTPTISSIGPTTAAETGTTIQVNGTNFQAGAIVSFIGTNIVSINASSTTVNSATLITCTTPVLPVANEPYDVKVTNTNGGSATLSDALDAGGVPAWTTAAGSLGTILHNATGTHFTLVAGDPDSTAVTYTETTSVLTTAGLTLNSTTGAITGDPTNQTEGSPTTYAFDVDASDGVNNTSRSFSITVKFEIFEGASGGTITTYSDGGVNYKAHTFTADGTFDAGSGGTADVLVIAGGGGGGNQRGGGGGAGGYLTATGLSLGNGTTYTMTVGAGGAGGDTSHTKGYNGAASSLTGSDITDVTTVGGGAGGSDDETGEIGGSGGGGGGGGFYAGAAGTAGQGNAGAGSVPGYSGNTGAGGGGAGGAGTAGDPLAGAGGAGLSNSYDGSATVRASGGGGGSGDSTNTPAATAGGGGRGSWVGGGTGGSGTANTGGGGGGGGGSAGDGGAGGSGIVVIRYIVS